MTNQELQLASVREVTGTAYGWPGDWHALFGLAGIPQGDFNGRLLAWINDYLSTSYAGLPQAMQAFAVDQGYINWSSMGTFDASGSVVYDFSAASLPTGATLERASTGTRFNSSGVLVSEAIDAARFDYTFNGSVWSLAGLLVEPQRTNISLNSQALNAAGGWNPARVTVTDDALAAPDGTTTAELVVPSADSGTHVISQSSTQTVAQVWTLSEFLRPGAGSYRAAMTLQNAVEADSVQANVNLGAPAITVQNLGQGSGAVGRLSLLNDGWLRASLTGTPDANGTSLRSTCFVANSGGSLSYVGDATNGIYVWGIQTELGAFPTSYIPTAGSTATRSADVLTLDLDDGDWNLEVVTPNGTFTTPSPVTSSGGYVFDWADLTGAATERHVLSITATGA